MAQQPTLFAPTCQAQDNQPTPLIVSPLPLAAYPVQTYDIRSHFSFNSNAGVHTTEKQGSWHLEPGEFAFWTRIIESGKSYLVGDDWSMSQFLKRYSSPLSNWQRMAYDFAIQNPMLVLHVETDRYEWNVYLRGEYVEFRLPYHDKGGEKSYVTRTGRTKVQVDDD